MQRNALQRNCQFIYLILFLLFAGRTGYAQSQTVSGTIKDKQTGEVLPGVSVIVKGTNTGPTTDQTGHFTLSVSPKSTLVFSFIGILRGNEFARKAARFNIDQEVNKWLKLRGSISYNTSNNLSLYSGSTPNTTFFLVSAARVAIALPPNVPAYNADGSYNISTASPNTIGMGNNQVVSNFGNPVALLDLNRYSSVNDRIIGSLGATAHLLKNLDFTTTYSIDRLRTDNVSFDSAIQENGYSTKGSVDNATAVRDKLGLGQYVDV